MAAEAAAVAAASGIDLLASVASKTREEDDDISMYSEWQKQPSISPPPTGATNFIECKELAKQSEERIISLMDPHGYAKKLSHWRFATNLNTTYIGQTREDREKYIKCVEVWLSLLCFGVYNMFEADFELPIQIPWWSVKRSARLTNSGHLVGVYYRVNDTSPALLGALITLSTSKNSAKIERAVELGNNHPVWTGNALWQTTKTDLVSFYDATQNLEFEINHVPSHVYEHDAQKWAAYRKTLEETLGVPVTMQWSNIRYLCFNCRRPFSDAAGTHVFEDKDGRIGSLYRIGTPKKMYCGLKCVPESIRLIYFKSMAELRGVGTEADMRLVLEFAIKKVNWSPRKENMVKTRAFCSQHGFYYEHVCQYIISNREKYKGFTEVPAQLINHRKRKQPSLQDEDQPEAIPSAAAAVSTAVATDTKSTLPPLPAPVHWSPSSDESAFSAKDDKEDAESFSKRQKIEDADFLQTIKKKNEIEAVAFQEQVRSLKESNDAMQTYLANLEQREKELKRLLDLNNVLKARLLKLS